MSVRCPYCQHVMELKGAHAGRFTPKCTACTRRFVLLIPEDANLPPLVGEMPAGAAAQGSIAGATHTGRVIAGASAESAAGRTVGPPPSDAMAPAIATRAPAMTAPPPGEAPRESAPRSPVAASASVAQASAPHAPASMTPASASHASASMVQAPALHAPARASHASATVAPGATIPPSSEPRADVGLSGTPGDLQARTYAKETLAPSGPTLSGSLGGYELIQKLGEGGMGAVYLARQVSLDRQVALKVLSPQLAADPQFVARFTREAYAAAQLSHHNVVQIHDIGFDRDINFFSMELVPGQTLEKLVNGEGRLDPEVAVGYVLQAARGLRFAHDHGLIHRDVKPDNLLLNDLGIVKVADLGLVKQAGKTEAGPSVPGLAGAAGVGKTQFNISMGTPAYMPPEQARDAAHVDHRADIYSLGCTLYDLLTGRPPFHGKTAIEVITKHQTEPIVPPDRVAKHVSPELSAVVMKMMAKRPDQRHQSMAEVVESLEAILGVESGKPFSPKEEHVRVLEASVEQFNGSTPARLRKNLVRGFFGACAAGAVLCALPQVGRPLLAGGLVGFAILTAVFYQALIGITQKAHLFTKVRQYVFGARVIDWLKFIGAAGVIGLLLVAFDLHWPWLAAAVAAGVAAAGFHFSIDRMVARNRATPLGQVEPMLKTMRLRGLDETALRQFVCKYSGDHWEEMYEALFGYEAKRAARRSWGKGERGRSRKRFGAWRDAVIDWIDRRTIARQEERERQLIARLEARAYAAKGLDPASANRKARQAADRLVDKAARVKDAARQRSMMTVLPTSSGRGVFADAKPLASWADGFEEDESKDKRHRRDGERVHESYFKRRFGTPLDLVLGPLPRMVLAAVLLCLFGLWMKQNTGLDLSDDQLATRADAVDLVEQGKTKIAELHRNYEARDSKPLRVTFLPIPDKLEDIAGAYNGGVAGVLLLLSAFFVGKRLGLIVLASAAFILVGHRLPIPLVTASPWIAAGIGLALGLLGIMFFRKTAADS